MRLNRPNDVFKIYQNGKTAHKSKVLWQAI
jgi:hypothetical protein